MKLRWWERLIFAVAVVLAFVIFCGLVALGVAGFLAMMGGAR